MSYLNTAFIILCLSSLLIALFLWFKKTSLKHFGVEIRVVNNKESCINAINELLSFNPKVVGYDCEWKANRIRGQGENKVSLIQIGNDKLIILIRIYLFADNIPIELISFLGNVDIIKCGVGIYGDVKKLKKDYNMDTLGCVDLNEIYVKNSDENDENTLGLEKFTNKILGESMQYKHCINHDCWEDNILNLNAIHYAADDAYVAYKIFKNIMATQYNKHNTGNIFEICFGKIDTNLTIKRKKNKHKIKQNNKQNNKINKGKIDLKCDKYGLITLLCLNNKLLSLIPIKMAKLFVRKQWVEMIDLYTLKLLFKVKPIDITHDDINLFVRGLVINETKCMVCGQTDNESNEDTMLKWHTLIPRQHNIFNNYKAMYDPYRVLLCNNCDILATKVKNEFRNELSKKLFTNFDERIELKKLWYMREMCWELKRKENRYNHSVYEQNKYVLEILNYCNIEYKNDILIRECDFNVELGIDWYNNKKDYNYNIIRDCIFIICDESDTNRRCSYIQKTLNESLINVWNGGNIKYCELWRNNFINKMRVKCVNKQYETFEININQIIRMDITQERICKYKILSVNGNLLTRCTFKCFQRLCDDSVAIRVNDTILQLLTENKKDKIIIWIPFKQDNCFICGNEFSLKLYDVLNECYYDKLCENNNGFKDKYIMQYHLILCNKCKLKADRIYNEFEKYLYWKYDYDNRNILNNDELLLESYAIQLSQKSQRYKLTIEEQNEYIKKILCFFSIDIENIIIKEYHCNNELDMDWYYVNEYNYIVIKECINKLIDKNKIKNNLCLQFKNNEIQFVKLWIDNFIQQITKDKMLSVNLGRFKM